ncbi:MAG: ribosome-associated translation inhibitor RaiA [Bacilli bacterium]|nr:ribosome-associated translation inhibitor RaiA [Bacilli bacterium]
MNMNIRGDKLVVTDAIKDYVKEKLSKLDKYFDDPSSIEAHVLLRSKNNKDTIEVTIPAKGFTLRAEESNADLYAAIDLVTDILERQIRKNKTRLNSRKNVQPEISFAFVEEDDEEEETSQIVKRKTVESKPMSEEEAILQMELLGHDFFVYKDADEECIAVLYKRKDNNYGIIYSK